MFVVCGAACGGAESKAPPAAVTTSFEKGTSVAPPAPEAKKAPSPERTVVVLEEEGKIAAAGMRALKSAELSGQREVVQELLTGLDMDACVRIVFSAGEPVVAQLTDDKGRVLAETASTANGKLGERGPVCIRRRETLRVQFASPGDMVVRFASWASP